jgi:hypothetical protein
MMDQIIFLIKEEEELTKEKEELEKAIREGDTSKRLANRLKFVTTDLAGLSQQLSIIRSLGELFGMATSEKRD